MKLGKNEKKILESIHKGAASWRTVSDISKDTRLSKSSVNSSLSSLLEKKLVHRYKAGNKFKYMLTNEGNAYFAPQPYKYKPGVVPDRENEYDWTEYHLREHKDYLLDEIVKDLEKNLKPEHIYGGAYIVNYDWTEEAIENAFKEKGLDVPVSGLEMEDIMKEYYEEAFKRLNKEPNKIKVVYWEDWEDMAMDDDDYY